MLLVLSPILLNFTTLLLFLPLSDSVKLFGVTLEKSLTFKKHANYVAQSCYYHSKALRHIRHCLDTHTASFIGRALISSRLDCCNSVLYGAPQHVTHKLQRAQNSLARIVLQSDSLDTPQLFYGNFIGYLFIPEYVSNLPPSYIKPSVQTLLNISLHTFAIINQSVLFAPQTSNFLSLLHPALTSALVLFIRPLLPLGTHYPSKSVHLLPSTPSNAA